MIEEVKLKGQSLETLPNKKAKAMREIRGIKSYALRRFRGVVLRVIKIYSKKVSCMSFSRFVNKSCSKL